MSPIRGLPQLATIGVLTIATTPLPLTAQLRRTEAEPDLALWLSVLVALVAVGLAGWFVFRTIPRKDKRGRAADPRLIFPMAHEARALEAPDFPVRPTSPTTAASAASSMPAAPVQPGGGDVVEGRTIRFFLPTDGTVQLLPGRLEIVAGDDTGKEIRFVRPPDGEPEVTFGRAEGPPHRHVQLRAGTVSRRHARMRFTDGEWSIANLSQTNPVVINGKELSVGNGSHTLRDGDKVEMGEILFEFRAR